MVSKILQNLESHKYKLAYSFIALFALWAIFVRFYKITNIGMEGDDVFWYWEMARKWATGHKEISFHYRPVTHLINAIGMSFFGINDYSIKITNSLVNLSTGIIIYFSGLYTIRNKYVSTLTAIVYLSLPFVIEESRSELSHILSTFFFLASYLFFVLYNNANDKKGQSFFLIGSGLLLGLAAHVHPDLATLGLPFVLYIFTNQYYKLRGEYDFKEKFRHSFVNNASLFSLSYFFVYLIIALNFGLFDVIKKLSQGLHHQQNNTFSRTFIEIIWRYIHGFYSYLEASITHVGATLFLAGLVIVLFFKLKKIKSPLITYLPMFLVSFHILTCIFAVQRKYILRLAHPSVPLALISSFYFLYRFLVYCNFKYRKSLLSIFAFSILYLSGTCFYQGSLYETKIYKLVHDQLKNQVNEENKILITPSLMHWYREGFKSHHYFGKNAVYLSQYRHNKWKFKGTIFQNFQELIKVNQIKYVALIKNDRNVRSELLYHQDAKVFFNTMYGITPKQYSIAWEYDTLRKTLEQLKASLIKENKKYEIYKISTLLETL